ncbi:imelysin family protein [Paracoccus pacificus]|uniref:Imelysin family protein n=1 Tax=Paracoccus pacificus TaxID=1463598 RepID=A0ABW4RBS3_9RHOB
MRNFSLILSALLPAGCAMLISGVAVAGTAEVVRDLALPGYQAFADQTVIYRDAAEKDCGVNAMREGYDAVFDTWLQVQPLMFGPAEEHGRALAVVFWPDPKGMAARSISAAMKGDPATLDDPEAFAKGSVAGRGLLALEKLLYDPALMDQPQSCALRRAIARDLARTGDQILTGWKQGYAEALLDPANKGDGTYLDDKEVLQMLYTQVLAALEMDEDKRIGRPLATADRPRPELAEAALSGRAQRNLVQSLNGIEAFVAALCPECGKTQAALDQAETAASALDDPSFAGIATPEGWNRLDAVRAKISEARQIAQVEIAGALGVTKGFNAADGD